MGSCWLLCGFCMASVWLEHLHGIRVLLHHLGWKSRRNVEFTFGCKSDHVTPLFRIFQWLPVMLGINDRLFNRAFKDPHNCILTLWQSQNHGLSCRPRPEGRKRWIKFFLMTSVYSQPRGMAFLHSGPKNISTLRGQSYLSVLPCTPATKFNVSCQFRSSMIMCVCVCTQLCPPLWPHGPVARQLPLSIGLSWQEYWSGLPFPSPGDLPNPGIKLGFPALQADSLPLSHLGIL